MKDLEQLMDAEGQNSLWYGIKEEDQEDPDPLWRWVSEGSRMGDGAPGGLFFLLDLGKKCYVYNRIGAPGWYCSLGRPSWHGDKGWSNFK